MQDSPTTKAGPAEVDNGSGSLEQSEASGVASGSILPEPGQASQVQFFESLFGSAQGYVCIARKRAGSRELVERFHLYPKQLDSVLRVAELSANEYDVYFCAQLLTTNQHQS
jgi:hypothetical protein